jgi:O-acetyl-ADP-ribose deacetylase (regulator of RNase III)
MHVVVDDLAFHASDAIVRPATARLDATTPMVRRLEQIGGPEFQRRLRINRDLAVGAAVVTGAGGDLAAEFVIHAVIQSDTEPATATSVRRAWQSALERAVDWSFARVSTPPLGTGAGNLSLEDASEIMVSVLKTHLTTADYPVEVTVVVESPVEREVFEAALRRWVVADS